MSGACPQRVGNTSAMRWKHVRNVFGSKSLYSLKKCFLPLYRSRLILPFLIKCRTFACRNILDVMNYGFVKVAASVPQVKVADTPPGVIFVLRNVNNGINIDRQNRLHPFYLVYVSDDGQVVVNHLQPKDLLDRMRYLCRDNDQVYERGVAEWKRETNDGHDMSHYAKLLTSAVQSIVSVKADSEVDSLFSTGGTTALTGNITGLDDFELIDMLIIRE